MAFLTQKEFHEAVGLLAKSMGLQRLRDKLVRYNALVSRRNVASSATLADQLYMLTSGLRKQVPATYAFHGIWSEQLREKLGEEGEQGLETLAKAVNECLSPEDSIIPEKTDALEAALGTYAQALVEKVGAEAAYLDMVLKAVPDVAQLLRTKGLPPAPAAVEPAPSPSDPAPTE